MLYIIVINTYSSSFFFFFTKIQLNIKIETRWAFQNLNYYLILICHIKVITSILSLIAISPND